jgi:uncharacterized protein (TIGR02001 family)
MKFKFAALAALATIAALPVAVRAEDAPSTTFNVGVVTDYRYRGISQTRKQPALQGGFDYSNPNGIYIGSWASTIKWLKDFGATGTVELDVYGGYKGEIAKDFTYDVGLLAYIYPGNKLKPDANTTEIYGALTYGAFTAKYSHSLTNTFGNSDSKNSGYLDLSATFEVADGWSVAPHIGHQRIAGTYSSVGSYNDYSLTVSKDFKGIVPSIALVGTDADKSFYSSGFNGKALGKTTLVLGVKYNF